MSENLGFRSQVEKEEIDWKAEQLGMNRSEFLNLAVKVMTQFDDEILKQLEKLAENARLSIPELIAAFVVRRLGDLAAEKEAGVSLDLTELIAPGAFNSDQKVLKNMCKQSRLDTINKIRRLKNG